MTRFLRFRPPTINQVMGCLFVVGLLSLVYLFGAAVMYFRLPTSDFLGKAFTGAEAWHERGRPSDSFPAGNSATGDGVTVDRPDKTWDGFTLYTTTQGARATLLDMRGAVVHRWGLPFGVAWPQPSHVRRSAIPEGQIHWFRCHLYANGDLLAIYHAEGDTPYGYGLVKLDKDSRLLWSYAGNAHHDVDVVEDGRIYTLSQKIESKPPEGLEYLPAPYIADSVVVLSAEGRELHNIPILEAFRDSPYALMLSAITNSPPPSVPAPPPGPPRALALTPGLPSSPPPPPSAPSPVTPALSATKGDLIHANSVKVLRPARASKFPLFKPGQVLISLRNLDALAVLDTNTRRVVWAARGIWRIQHDAEFLANGHLLLFDNGGSTRGCRVLEYDPVTQALPWSYANEHSAPFRALFRGMKQGLPNGNVLIVDPDGGRILEITPDKELVWESFCPRAVTGAHRYRADELTFLKGAARARP